jgi:hypothetical protein
MNEEAIQDSYNVFVSQGYTKSIDEFKKLINTNPNALNDSYKAFANQGYSKSIDDYKSLMGIGSQPQAAPVLKKKGSSVSNIPQQQKTGTTELPSADGSSATQQPPKKKSNKEHSDIEHWQDPNWNQGAIAKTVNYIGGLQSEAAKSVFTFADDIVNAAKNSLRGEGFFDDDIPDTNTPITDALKNKASTIKNLPSSITKPTSDGGPLDPTPIIKTVATIGSKIINSTLPQSEKNLIIAALNLGSANIKSAVKRIDKYQEQTLPKDNIPTNVVKGIVGMAPDLVAAAILENPQMAEGSIAKFGTKVSEGARPLLKKYAPKAAKFVEEAVRAPFTKIMAAKGTVAGMASAKEGEDFIEKGIEGGIEGAKEGMYMHTLGVAAGKAMPVIAKGMSKTGLNSAIATAVANPLANAGVFTTAKALRTGIEEQRLISGEEAAMEAGTGIGFSLLHAGSLYKNHNELNHYYDNTLKTDPLESLGRVLNETKDNLELVYNPDLNETQIKDLEEARDEIKTAILKEPDLNNKKLLGDEALKIQNQLDAHSAIKGIVENKEALIDAINSNEDLSQEVKSEKTKKIAAMADYFDNSEFGLKKKELNSRIEEAQKNLDDAALSFTNLKKPSDRIQAKLEVDKRRAELDALNNELTDLIKNKDAIQKQTTDESVLRTEQPELGLQGVGEGNAKPEGVTAEETIINEKPQEELIEIPTDEIEALKEDISRAQNEGTLSENVDEKVYRGNEEGTIKIEGQQYIFETNQFKHELGNIDEVGDTPLALLDISIFPQEGMKTEPITEGEKPSVVSVDGKEYTFLRQRRPKKGESIVVLKDNETGLQKAFRGDKAERILKDISLQKPAVEKPLTLTVEGKEGEVKTAKEIKREQRLANKEARQEFEAKSLEEIDQMQKELYAEASKIEQELLQTIAKESKKENRLIFKLGEKEFAVTQKADKEFSVSQKNKEGKFVGIKDEKSRINAIEEFKKIKESKDTQRLKDAEDLSNEYKKEQEDKILKVLDKAIEATSSKGKAFDATLGIPLMIANNSLKIVKAAYKGGKSLTEAISEGYKFLKGKGYGVSEFEFKKYVLNNISKPTEIITPEPKSSEPKPTTKEKQKSAPSPIKSDIYFGEGRIISVVKDIAKITMTEKAALVKKIKDLARGGKDAQKAIREATQALTKEIIGLREGGKINKPQEKAILNRLSKTNVLSETSVRRYIDYVSKVYADAEYTSELNKARDTKKKISELSKDKDKNPSLKELGKKFMSIEPSMVDDIYAYNKTAIEIEKAIKGSNKRKFEKTVVIDEVNKYIDEVLDNQYKKLKEEINAESSSIIDEDIRDDVENNKEIEKEKEKELRVKIKNQFDIYVNQIKEAIRTGENPLTGEEVSYTEKDKKTIQRFMDMDLSLLKTEDAIFASDALQNFLANKSTAKMDSVLFSYEGVKNIKELEGKGIKSRELTKFNSKALGRQLADKVTSLPVMFEKMFPGLSRSGEVMDKIGMTKLFNKRSESLTEGNNIVDDFVKKLYKKKANGEDYNTEYNITERALAAHAIRSLIGTKEQIQQEFNDRKSLIDQSIERLSKGNDKQKHQAELYKKAYDKILKDSNTADEVLAKTDKNNKEGVDFWIEEYAKKYDQSADVSENIYNTKLERDLNYTPMKLSKLNYDSKEVELDNDQSSFHNNNGSIIVKKTGSLHEIKRISKLPEGTYIDLSFDKNMANSMYDLLTDINTAGPIRQIKAAINSPEFDILVPHSDDRALLKGGGKNKMGRIELYVKLIRNKSPYSTSEDMKSLNKLANIGVGQALAGLAQPVKQVIPVAVSTFINTKGKLQLGATFDPIKLAFINKSGYSIANRGRQSQAEIESVNKLIEKSEGSIGSKAMKYIEKANELQLKYLLEKPDVYIAKASWLTYYEEALKKQGLNIKDLDYSTHELNEEAANYAQRQVDRQQNISDHDLAGRLYTDKSSYAQIFTKMLMPFSSFRMNASAKFGADMITLRDKTASKEDKAIAKRSIAGYAAEMAMFRIISIGSSLLIGSLANKYLGKDESDEDFEKRRNNLIKGAATGTFTDLFSPVPVLDPFIQTAGAKLTEGIDELMGTNIAIYDVPKQEFLKEYGTLGISIDRLGKLWTLGNLAATGKYKDDFGKEKQIPEEDRMALIPLVPLSLATDLGLAPTEINSTINNVVKFSKKSKEGMSQEQLKKLNPEMYERMYGKESASYRIKERQKERDAELKKRMNRD